MKKVFNIADKETIPPLPEIKFKIGLAGDLSMKKSFLFILILFHLIFAGCKQEKKIAENSLTINLKDQSFYIYHSGNDRGGKIFVPGSYNKSKKYSLVFGLHGMGGTGAGFQANGFDTFAERLDFIMVYPDALEGRWEITPGGRSYKDDLDFFQTLINELKKEFSIDEKRIYATGHSYGGFMTYRLAYELSPYISAVAPVAGLALKTSLTAPDENVSVLHIHSLNDETVLYDGGNFQEAYSAPDSVQFWKDLNMISGNPAVETLETGADLLTWFDKTSGTTTALCTYPAGGHSMPTESTELICTFFYNHPARENRIFFDNPNISQLITSDDPIEIKTVIENPGKITSLALYSGDEKVAEKKAPPFTFSFKPEMNRSYNLHLKARLPSGTTLVSPDSLFFWVTSANKALSSKTDSSGNESILLGPENAVDGNIRTRWASTWDNDNYIQLDLESTQTISGVSLIWETAYGSDYTIDVSDNGREWTTVFTRKRGTGGTEFITFDPVKARYIRLQGIQRATQWGYSLWEFMVH